MSRYGSDKPDQGTREIVQRLRSVGARVEYIGKPLDLLVGFQRRFSMLEIKRKGAKPRNDQMKQQELIRDMKDEGLPVYVVHDFDEAFDAILTTSRRRNLAEQ